MIKVEIDAQSGFCGGVIRAIGKAEKYLENQPRLYSLGEMVHNEAELERLGAKGLISLQHEDMARLPAGEALLIRAHGEPPATYAKASGLGLNIIDCTCPVVLRLQESILEAHRRLEGSGTIVIFGKIGHAEVLGLVGQVGGDAVVVENAAQLKEHLRKGDIKAPVELFSQTTMNPAEYEEICNYLISKGIALNAHNTICRQVAERHRMLADFAKGHDVIVFVSGSLSSNGRVLFELCHSANPRTYMVGSVRDIDGKWFKPSDSVGVCGATSTPKWLLEEVARHISTIS